MFNDPRGLKYEEKDLSPGHPVHYHRSVYDEDSAIRLHYHESLEINLILDCEGSAYVEGRSLDLSETCLLVLPPRTIHSYRIRGNGGQIRVWHLGTDCFRMLNTVELRALFEGFRGALSLDKVNEDLLDSLDKMEKGSLLEKSAAVLLLMEQLRAYNRSGPKIKDDFLHDVIRHAEEHFREKISLDDAAARAHLSRYHFCRKFKERSGSSYSSYLNNLRLEFSLTVIDRGASVEQAALESGFEDPSYYIKRFKDFYGITPGRYRNYLKRG